ncbi:hypothetical protein ECC02_009688 [Trypanosoma cruzi]|uniref:Secreted protein n=1 Tax=Trypanosoma cruzi TaxID=5693 RepID=A0A7J6XSJ8_TRYCR|nr:hypothetical protein ECC02_009688 [Trypanosoma cruzi]
MCVRTSFIFHGVICVFLLPSALSSARECGPQSTVTRVCMGTERSTQTRRESRPSIGRVSAAKEKKSSGGREMLTGLPAREMNTKTKKKRKTRRQGVAVCVWRCGCLPALAAKKKTKQDGKKCVLRPTGPRRTPTRHGSLSAPFVAAPPHACSRRGAQGRRHERVGGCASGAVGRETHGTPHRKSAEETIKRGKSRKEKNVHSDCPKSKKGGMGEWEIKTKEILKKEKKQKTRK